MGGAMSALSRRDFLALSTSAAAVGPAAPARAAMGYPSAGLIKR
ncbi:twin-arginine translocation signal domain-containing protein [Bradyrhizobium guangdongense]